MTTGLVACTLAIDVESAAVARATGSLRGSEPEIENAAGGGPSSAPTRPSVDRRSSDLGDLVEAAVDLAWRPYCNTANRAAYRGRRAAHERLCAALASLAIEPDDSDLGDLIRAIRRACAQSYSNRRGTPYFDRKTAIEQLRGSLDVFLRGKEGSPET